MQLERAAELVKASSSPVVYCVGAMPRTRYSDYDHLRDLLDFFKDYGLTGVIRRSPSGFGYLVGDVVQSMDLELFMAQGDFSAGISDATFLIVFTAGKVLDADAIAAADPCVVPRARTFGLPVLGVSSTAYLWEDNAHLYG